jgi:Protein of unknown function (DUF2971).
MKAYYFTTAQHGIDNVRRKRIKISQLSDLNDPFELLAPELSTETLRIAFSRSLSEWAGHFGIICLSKGPSNPLMWSHYGDRHRGICLGFDLVDQYVMPINYSVERLKLDIERWFSEGTLDETTMKLILSTKFGGWAYEDEVRLWLRLEERDAATNLFFKEFSADISLREVILGPRCTLSDGEVQDAVRAVDDVEAYRSRLSFSSFNVEPSECIFKKA